MMNLIKPIILLSVVLITAACSTQQQTIAPLFGNEDRIKFAIKEKGTSWEGVKYRYGGVNPQKGFDCSALVQLLYKDQFDITLPRTTRQQVQVGESIQKTSLKAGDLVFFKTGRSMRHVGVYIEAGKFLHVSSSKGVMVSSLDNPYWSKRYWKSTRPEKSLLS